MFVLRADTVDDVNQTKKKNKKELDSGIRTVLSVRICNFQCQSKERERERADYYNAERNPERTDAVYTLCDLILSSKPDDIAPNNNMHTLIVIEYSDPIFFSFFRFFF